MKEVGVIEYITYVANYIDAATPEVKDFLKDISTGNFAKVIDQYGTDFEYKTVVSEQLLTAYKMLKYAFDKDAKRFIDEETKKLVLTLPDSGIEYEIPLVKYMEVK